ncbi:invasion associated locus B family protein [Bradyrhizobium erythrophlei]|jgi:invasion protein IalB|uniref:Invasion protein IalB, involved in pathogenesis n=1 Tax=Bradyrhizobium erythrophlei TaxID=1437360 RepID=A0A1M7TKW2_9BRAD|nr:invasion associated locus B family protein [Bradyrhizobium erythrophlei]SHN71367.1 Invasion protein IalB, involved in pathogenesis [Bradyrhizobium erythrophlei]
MRDCCHQKSISSIIVALLSLPMSNFVAHGQQGTPAEPVGVETKMEFSLRGQRDARAIKYGDWRKFCFQTPGAKTVCRTTISGKWETGQSAVRVDFIEREGEDAARLQLFLPVGLYLQAAARLTVDQGKPFRIPFVWCLTNTCIAGDRANPALIRQMETGQQLKLEVADTNLLSVSTMLPLSQFASVRKAAASRIFKQEVDE